MNSEAVFSHIDSQIPVFSGLRVVVENSPDPTPPVPYILLYTIKGQGYRFKLRGGGGVFPVVANALYIAGEKTGAMAAHRVADALSAGFSNYKVTLASGDVITANSDPVTSRAGYNSDGKFYLPISINFTVYN